MRGSFKLYAVLSCACMMGPAFAVLRPEPNAFLNKPAHTTKQLVAQVKEDPEVMDRFVRHFRMNKPELIAYLSSLKLVRLKQDGYYTIFNADKDNVIGSRLFHIKKGALIWAEPDGTLVLKKGCGNPLSTGPRAVVHPSIRTEAAMVPKRLVKEIPIEGQAEPVELIPADELLQPAYVAELPPEVSALPDTPVTEMLPTTSPVGHGFPSPLLLVPLLFTLGDGGGGGGPGGGGGGGGGNIPGPAAALVFVAMPALRYCSRKMRR